jgi:hypothetical protein
MVETETPNASMERDKVLPVYGVSQMESNLYRHHMSNLWYSLVCLEPFDRIY